MFRLMVIYSNSHGMTSEIVGFDSYVMAEFMRTQLNAVTDVSVIPLYPHQL